MYIVADIGGTKMRVAASDSLETLGETVMLDTPQEYDAGFRLLCDTAQKLSKGKIDAVAAGVPGALSENKKKLLTARHLPLWQGKALASELEGALKAPVHLENDTAQVGLGEAVFGAGKGARIVVYITVSTGVNGVRIVGGAVDEGHFEIGGQYLSTAEVPDSLEDLVSGAAISQKYGVHPKEIEKDSPVWEELARLSALGVHNTILHWSPERVVLGGSMFNEIGIPVDRVKYFVSHYLRKFSSAPDIVHSSLGDVGGLWGGLAKLKSVR